jgi:hypothetical protein
MNSTRLFLILFAVLITGPKSWALEVPGLVTVANGDAQLFLKPKEGTSKESQVLYEGKVYFAKKVKIGEKVFSETVVHTGPTGKVRIVYPNGDQINVAPSSSVVISREGGPSGDQTNLQMLYGKLRAVVTKRENAKEPKFMVKTPTAVAGVRGTDFAVGFNPASSEGEVSVIRGKVQVATLDEKVAQDLKSGESVAVQTPVVPPKVEGAIAEAAATIPPQPLFKVTAISQQQLTELKTIVAVADTKSLAEVSKELVAEIKKTEEVAVTKTIESLKAEDPKLYEKLQLAPSKDISDIDSAVIGDLMKTAPDIPVKTAEKELKKIKEGVEKLGEEIYKGTK